MIVDLKDLDVSLVLNALTKLREYHPVGFTKKEMEQVNHLASILTSAIVKDVVRGDLS